ncbi:MAG: tRNA (guanosine(37)-N1)-methyltransferase TrmD [Opitutales bacterium]
MEPPVQIDVVTLFPGMLQGFVTESMLGRAVENGLLKVTAHNLRDWAHDKHHTTDDRPFGGGAGMVLKPEPLFEAIDELKRAESEVIYLCPDGERLTPVLGRALAQRPHLILLSGHYEGMDERVRVHRVTREVSIGDYVLTNGTLAAAVLIDCLARYIPAVLGEEMSLTQDSFNDNLLSFPQYTRPADYDGLTVPEVLLSGDHGAIAAWRQSQREARTRARRPDLFNTFQATTQNRPSS